ncbi:transposase [Phycicoccus elongatus Lp2]|uniref:Transposase n=1 Tax=Phycicoccus elongatus Lp2 TaxID=1193181 RepID=N0E3K5_9MICO|nr:transposase [Phycicoccus elongatus Lp2]
MIVAYIDSHRERFGVEPICAVLSEHGVPIAPSTYYAHKAATVSAAVLEDAYLANALYTLWVENWGVYGARKLWKAARRAKLDVGRDEVARLMRIAGIRGVVRGRLTTVTTRSEGSATRHPDLVKRGWDTPTAPDELWVADFSYVWTLTGFVYVAFIVDVFSRRILGWRVATGKQTPLVTDALHQALTTRKVSETGWDAAGLIHHSDAGSQGGFNWSSQHLDHGGVWWRRATGAGRRAMRLRGCGGSGVLIGRCGRRCAHRGDLTPRGWCSGSSGDRSPRALRRRRHRSLSGCRSRWGCVSFVTLAACRRSALPSPQGAI